MTARILQGDVFSMLPTIEPGSVNCCVTSPPYWNLRSYLPKGHPLKPLELGSEKTPAEYIANMVRVFGLVRDCLADHGTCWVNIGDTYSSGSSGESRLAESIASTRGGGHSDKLAKVARKAAEGYAAGNLCLIPQRLAISLQDDGWIVRSVIVWQKPSAMPSSLSGWAWRRCRVKVAGQKSSGRRAAFDESSNGRMHDIKPDQLAEWSDCPGCKKCSNGGYVLRKGSWRPTSSYEPVLMLAKSATYFADGEPVKTAAAEATVSRDRYTRVLDDPDEQFAVRHDHETICDSGANLRDVWRIAAEKLSEKHYAAFPTELVRRCLQAGTSAKGYCPTCGGPWVRMLESRFVPQSDVSEDRGIRGAADQKPMDESNGWEGMPRGTTDNKTICWRASCKCPPAEPRPGRVLDPFCGSARTGITAMRLGLDFIGCELNPEYIEMAERILRDEAPLFQ